MRDEGAQGEGILCNINTDLLYLLYDISHSTHSSLLSFLNLPLSLFTFGIFGRRRRSFAVRA
jgi:hypothetical protein